MVQRHAASTRIPGSREFIKCLSAICGGGLSRPHSRAALPPSGEAPRSSLQKALGRNFRWVPSPQQASPPPSRRALPPAAWWRRGEGGQLAPRARGLAFLPGGGERRARSQPGSEPGPRPPGRSEPLRGRALPPSSPRRSRQPPAFGILPPKGAWRRRRGGTESGGEKRNPESETARGRGRGPERRRPGSEGSAAAPPARPHCISVAALTSPGCLTRGIMHWLTGSELLRDLF